LVKLFSSFGFGCALFCLLTGEHFSLRSTYVPLGGALVGALLVLPQCSSESTPLFIQLRKPFYCMHCRWTHEHHQSADR